MVENSTKLEKAYLPTKTEEALLEVLLNPANRLKTVEDQCKMVPCDKKTYYNAFKKQGFNDLYREMSLALITRNVAPVVNACVREAVRGSAVHIKIALTMADMYSEKSEQKLSNPDGTPLSIAVSFVKPNGAADEDQR